MSSRVTRWARSVWSGIRNRQQIEALGPGAAADLGIALADATEAARQPGDVPERMQKMAALLGVEGELAGIDRYQLQDMARTCAACVERGFCDHALHRPGGTRAEDVGFCPNVRTYQDMARRGGHSD